MLVFCTVNPAGKSSTYNGLYFRQDELRDKDLHGITVKAKHMVATIGAVVGSNVGQGQWEALLMIDKTLCRLDNEEYALGLAI